MAESGRRGDQGRYLSTQNARLTYTILVSADNQEDFSYPLPDSSVNRRVSRVGVMIDR